MFEDSAAGRAAVEFLIEEGKLVPDFWLRANEAHRITEDTGYEQRCQEVADAVQFAMGKAGVELPTWASPTNEAPDCTWIHPEMRKEFPRTELYHSTADLLTTYLMNHDLERLNWRDENKLRTEYSSIVLRTWRRLIPHFSNVYTENILSIEQERGNNGNTFSKPVRIANILNGVILRDSALYDLYIEQGENDLKSVFHGIGQKAILGVGAMLFHSGEHDDLLPQAEKLHDLLTDTA